MLFAGWHVCACFLTVTHCGFSEFASFFRTFFSGQHFWTQILPLSLEHLVLHDNVMGIIWCPFVSSANSKSEHLSWHFASLNQSLTVSCPADSTSFPFCTVPLLCISNSFWFFPLLRWQIWLKVGFRRTSIPNYRSQQDDQILNFGYKELRISYHCK